MIMDLDENNIKNQLSQEKLDVCIVSYGGSASNTLRTSLEINGYVCSTKIWREILCHCPTKININIPIIYIYRDPIKAFLSMRRRGDNFYLINQRKLSNNTNIHESDELLLELMIKQFHSWTRHVSDTILIIKYEELFSYEIGEKLESFLHRKLQYFPISFVSPTINDEYINNLNETDIELFNKYKEHINYINNFSPVN